MIYVSSIIRSITALHDLLQNKIRFDEAMSIAAAGLVGGGGAAKKDAKDEKAVRVCVRARVRACVHHAALSRWWAGAR